MVSSSSSDAFAGADHRGTTNGSPQMAETDVAKRRDPTHAIGPSTLTRVLAVSSPPSAVPDPMRQPPELTPI